MSMQLGNAIQNVLQGNTGTYGIAIKNLKTGEGYTLNANQQFSSGSLYKLWVMTVVCQELQQNKLRATDILSKNIQDLDHEFGVPDDDTTDPTTGTITQSVDDALYQMITISDNNSALLLTDKIHVSSIASFLQKYGFSQSQVGIGTTPPETTALDMALYLEDLYKGTLANKTYTQKMIDLLKQQRLNDKLPKYLPSSVIVAHKTGELDDFSHDAGIVYSPSGDYIVVVLTQTSDTDAAKETIAQISQAAYNYFNPTSPISAQ